MTKKIKISFFTIFLFIILAIGTYFIYLHYNKSIKIKFDYENPFGKTKFEAEQQKDIEKLPDGLKSIFKSIFNDPLFKEITKQYRENYKFNDKITSNISFSKDKKFIIVSRLKKEQIDKKFKFAETFAQHQNIIYKVSFYFKIIEKEKDNFELEFLPIETDANDLNNK